MGDLILEFGTIEELETKAKNGQEMLYISKIFQDSDKFQRIVYGFENSKFYIEFSDTKINPRTNESLFLEETRHGQRINFDLKTWKLCKTWTYEQLEEYHNNFRAMDLNPLTVSIHPESIERLVKEKEQMKTKLWILEKENRELKTKISNQESWIEKVKNLLRFKKYSRISSI